MTITQTVNTILRDHPASRNSDKVLILEVFARYGFRLTPIQEDKFFDLPSVETVRRVRQKIQESGKYLADKPIHNQRHFKSLQMRQITPSATPRYIEQIMNDNRPMSEIKDV